VDVTTAGRPPATISIPEALGAISTSTRNTGLSRSTTGGEIEDTAVEIDDHGDGVVAAGLTHADPQGTGAAAGGGTGEQIGRFRCQGSQPLVVYPSGQLDERP
jgi:hypothetical protein